MHCTYLFRLFFCLIPFTVANPFPIPLTSTLPASLSDHNASDPGILFAPQDTAEVSPLAGSPSRRSLKVVCSHSWLPSRPIRPLIEDLGRERQDLLQLPSNDLFAGFNHTFESHLHILFQPVRIFQTSAVPALRNAEAHFVIGKVQTWLENALDTMSTIGPVSFVVVSGNQRLGVGLLTEGDLPPSWWAPPSAIPALAAVSQGSNATIALNATVTATNSAGSETPSRAFSVDMSYTTGPRRRLMEIMWVLEQQRQTLLRLPQNRGFTGFDHTTEDELRLVMESSRLPQDSDVTLLTNGDAVAVLEEVQDAMNEMLIHRVLESGPVFWVVLYRGTRLAHGAALVGRLPSWW